MDTSLDIEKNLQLFANWESVVPYFSLRERGKNDPYIRIIKPLLKRLDRRDIAAQKVSYLNNYYGFFAYPVDGEAGKLHGLVVFLSLLAPVAVFARRTGRKLEGEKVEVGSFLEVDDVLSPDETRTNFERTVVQEIRLTDYSFLLAVPRFAAPSDSVHFYSHPLTREAATAASRGNAISKGDVDKPLPESVKIRHHSYPDKRYFHAIFDWYEDY